MVGKARKACHQLQHKGDGTAVFPKGRLRTMNLGPCPHAYAPYLFLFTLMTTSTMSACRHRMYCNCVMTA